VQKWVAYVQRELESFIPEDPFEDIVTMLDHGEAFSFSRFGDGEFNAIFGVDGANCDGHPYYPDLGSRLRKVVESKPDYLMGLQPLAVVFHGARQISGVAGDRAWVLADSLHLASKEGRLGRFFDTLVGRNVTLVGPGHLHELSEAREWTHHTVPSRKCWTQYSEIRELLKGSIPAADGVVLFCASMMSNVLIDDLYRFNSANTYIDAGSVFDPYAGIDSRAYQRGLGQEATRQIEAYGVR
jgi:hypothetical protein